MICKFPIKLEHDTLYDCGYIAMQDKRSRLGPESMAHDDCTGPRFLKVAMIAISAGMATFFIISQSGGRITPVVMTAAIPAQVCYHGNFYETGPCIALSQILQEDCSKKDKTIEDLNKVLENMRSKMESTDERISQLADELEAKEALLREERERFGKEKTLLEEKIQMYEAPEKGEADAKQQELLKVITICHFWL